MDLKEIDLFIFDLDGVIYLGNKPVPGAKETLEILEEREKKVYFLTNNSTRTRKKFSEKLREMDIKVDESKIITSAYGTAHYLQTRSPKATVFVIGEDGLITELDDAGLKVLSCSVDASHVEYVVVGLDQYFEYQRLAFALTAIEKGAHFIATNADPTLPTEHGNLPGAGSMVSALSTAAYRKPMIIIGKPNTYMVEFILDLEKSPPSRAVIIGDRYTTDMKAGFNAGVGTIMVKTGVGKQELGLAPKSGPFPDLIIESVAELPKYL